jgi:SAM-dependent methyltransferase
MVERATKALDGMDIVEAATVTDVQALPFEGGAFDVVIANHMLYHVPDRPRAVAEIARVLRPGGTLFAATNGMGHMSELFKIVSALGDAVDRGTPTHAAFSLENGAAQLGPSFPVVDRLDFHDGLRVTDADALVAYLESGFVKPGASTSAMREALAGRIAVDGAIEITKSVGLFVARKS